MKALILVLISSFTLSSWAAPADDAELRHALAHIAAHRQAAVETRRNAFVRAGAGVMTISGVALLASFGQNRPAWLLPVSRRLNAAGLITMLFGLIKPGWRVPGEVTVPRRFSSTRELRRFFKAPQDQQLAAARQDPEVEQFILDFDRALDVNEPRVAR